MLRSNTCPESCRIYRRYRTRLVIMLNVSKLNPTCSGETYLKSDRLQMRLQVSHLMLLFLWKWYKSQQAVSKHHIPLYIDWAFWKLVLDALWVPIQTSYMLAICLTKDTCSQLIKLTRRDWGIFIISICHSKMSAAERVVSLVFFSFECISWYIVVLCHLLMHVPCFQISSIAGMI
jgi:hypothetical protein